jgi:hypothetical protein
MGAIHAWLNDFMTMYAVTATPDDVTYPYGTYSIPQGSLDSGTMSGTITLWFYTESEAEPNEAAQALSKRIGRGGVTIPFDGGYAWITRGTNWCQPITDEVSPSVKGRYLQINIQYFTED